MRNKSENEPFSSALEKYLRQKESREKNDERKKDIKNQLEERPRRHFRDVQYDNA